MECYLTVTCANCFFCSEFVILKTLIYRKKSELIGNLVFKKFLIHKYNGKRYQISTVLTTNSFTQNRNIFGNWFLVSTIAVLVKINSHPAELRFFIIAASSFSCL